MMEKIKEGIDLNEIKDYLISYISKVHKKQAEFLIEYTNELSEDDLKYFLEDLIENGIPLCQEPFWENIDIVDLIEICKEYDIKHCEMENIINNLTVGELYFMRLILALLYSNI